MFFPHFRGLEWCKWVVIAKNVFGSDGNKKVFTNIHLNRPPAPQRPPRDKLNSRKQHFQERNKHHKIGSFPLKYFWLKIYSTENPFTLKQTNPNFNDQGSSNWLTLFSLMIVHKVVTKAIICKSLYIFQFNPIHLFVKPFTRSHTFLEHF